MTLPNSEKIRVYGPGIGLKGRLTLMILLFSLIPVLFLGLVGDRALKNGLKEGLERKLDDAVTMKIRDVDRYFEEMNRVIMVQSKRVSNQTLLESLIEGFAKSDKPIRDYVDSEDWMIRTASRNSLDDRIGFSDFRDAFLVDLKGNILYTMSNKGALGANVFSGMYKDRPFSYACQKALRTSGPVFSDYDLYMEGQSEKTLGHMIIRMFGTDETVIGLLVIQCDVEDLNRIMADHQDIGQTFEMYLVGSDKRLRSDSGKRKERKALKYQVTTEFIRFLDQGGLWKGTQGSDMSAKTYKGLDGVLMIGTHRNVLVGDGPYTLIGEIEEGEAFGVLHTVRQGFVLFVFGMICLVFLLSSILIGAVVRPVLVMTDWARNVATGDLTLWDMSAQDDEMGQFIQSFRQVVLFLRETSRLALSVASGDFNLDIEPRSANDELGRALQQMAHSLRDAAEAMTALSTGNFDARVTVKGPNDHFSKSLNSMVRQIKSTHDANENQARMKSLQTELNEIMRGDQTVHELARRILAFFCISFDASVGAFYLPDDSGSCLNLYSSFACDHLPVVIRPGEGLPGQVMIEKQKIILDHCPDNYMVIHGLSINHSALSVLVFPFVREDRLEAIIEMGSLKQMTHRELEFMELVSESVSIAISSAISRVKMSELLEKTVKQSEDLKIKQDILDGTNRDLQAKTLDLQQTEVQLRKQEAELRAANLDLMRQAEKLKNSEKRLKLKEDELISANATLEERSMNLEEQKNAIKEKNIQLELTQKELLEKSDRLENSSRYKSEFLANMSHELRTPLNSILLISRLLTENKWGNLSKKQIEFAQTIQSSGLDLLTLIDDILDLSKIESGKMEIRISRFSIKEFREKIIAGFEPICRDKGIGFAVKLDKAVPDYVYFDFKRIDQVVKNLVANAIKFTTQGQVTLSIRIPEKLSPALKNRCKPEETLLLSVEDSGIGISEDKLDVIFEAFKQADGAISRQYGGTGLGLSISRQLVRLMGGDIWVESLPGKGSTFSVFIPGVFEPPTKGDVLQVPAESAQPLPGNQTPLPGEVVENQDITTTVGMVSVASSPVFEGKKILIVDNDMRNVYALMHSLGDYGMDIRVAKTGKECMAILENNPDVGLVIMDIMMTDSGGYEAMASIRGQKRFKDLPVIALTAKAMKGDREKCLEAGASDYLSKPVDMDRLISVMKEMLT